MRTIGPMENFCYCFSQTDFNGNYGRHEHMDTLVHGAKCFPRNSNKGNGGMLGGMQFGGSTY